MVEEFQLPMIYLINFKEVNFQLFYSYGIDKTTSNRMSIQADLIPSSSKKYTGEETQVFKKYFSQRSWGSFDSLFIQPFHGQDYSSCYMFLLNEKNIESLEAIFTNSELNEKIQKNLDFLYTLPHIEDKSNLLDHAKSLLDKELFYLYKVKKKHSNEFSDESININPLIDSNLLYQIIKQMIGMRITTIRKDLDTMFLFYPLELYTDENLLEHQIQSSLKRLNSAGLNWGKIELESFKVTSINDELLRFLEVSIHGP